eukprot:c12379_g1_i2.p1 GENE.c12379_g1_i2~~c12379_g1_i2.p1  ORF type:complete len:582 (-),score=129.01 c12379_g1_i2:168-1844(-)
MKQKSSTARFPVFVVALVIAACLWSRKNGQLSKSPSHSNIDNSEMDNFVIDARRKFGAFNVNLQPQAIARTSSGNRVKVVVSSCRAITERDILSVLTRFQFEFVDDTREADAVLRCGVVCTSEDSVNKECLYEKCPAGKISPVRLDEMGPRTRHESLIAMWQPSPSHPGTAIGLKDQLCLLSFRVFSRTAFAITPPCYAWPEHTTQLLAAAPQYPYWLYKPSLSSSGKGLVLLNQSQITRDALMGLPEGLIQQYVHNPLLYDASLEPSGPNVVIKTDIRIYGVVTSVEPLRFYISKRGYFRSGHPHFNYTMTQNITSRDFQQVHFTNNGPKSGLDPEVIWNDIHRAFTFLFVAQNEELIVVSRCRERGDCSKRLTEFFADVSVSDTGDVRILEIHPSCSLKPPQRSSTSHGGEMEGGYDAVVTASARQATWGVFLMKLADFLDPKFRHVAELWLNNAIASGAVPTQHLDNNMRQALISSAMEFHLTCVLGLESSLPGRWTSILQNSTPKQSAALKEWLPWRSMEMYRLWEASRLSVVAQHFSGRHNVTGDCKPLQWEV